MALSEEHVIRGCFMLIAGMVAGGAEPASVIFEGYVLSLVR